MHPALAQRVNARNRIKEACKQDRKALTLVYEGFADRDEEGKPAQGRAEWLRRHLVAPVLGDGVSLEMRADAKVEAVCLACKIVRPSFAACACGAPEFKTLYRRTR